MSSLQSIIIAVVSSQKYVVEHLQRSNISPDEIMVLTPYRAHKDHIKELLPNKVEVNTVHGSQGW